MLSKNAVEKLEDITKHIKLQDKNLIYWKKRAGELEEQIHDMTHITEVINDVSVALDKPIYTSEEITSAYNKMLKYEGITKDRTRKLIVDTFIEFLNDTHHSLK